MDFPPSRSRREYNRRQAQVFDRAVESFEQPVPKDVLERLRLVVEEAALEPGCAVLDVGTGTGVLLPFILAKGPARVVACDLSTKMLARARRRFEGPVQFHHMDVTDMPQEEGPFDAAFCNACFANFYDQRSTARAISALLAPEGRLVISHPMGRGFVLHLKEENRELQLHDLPESEAAARALLEPAGLRVGRFQDDPLLYLLIARKDA